MLTGAGVVNTGPPPAPLLQQLVPESDLILLPGSEVLVPPRHALRKSRAGVGHIALPSKTGGGQQVDSAPNFLPDSGHNFLEGCGVVLEGREENVSQSKYNNGILQKSIFRPGCFVVSSTQFIFFHRWLKSIKKTCFLLRVRVRVNR